MTIEDTLQLALEAHRCQTDLDGMPFVLHPLAVGLMGSSEAEIKTGFLHDVVEDTSLTLDDLRTRGVDENVLTALALLTHDKSLDYFDYVRRIIASGNRLAIRTKLSDLRHNISRGARSYRRALERGDTSMSERLARINAKHQQALNLFSGIALADYCRDLPTAAVLPDPSQAIPDGADPADA